MSFIAWIRRAGIILLWGSAHSSVIMGEVTKSEVIEAVRHAGAETERRLLDLLMSDFYAGLSAYYKNKGQNGFMALERFQFALERAIGDIRETAHLVDDKERHAAVLKIHQNWQQAFGRAPLPNRPSLTA